ncbi:MAG: hypothetical protein P4L56_11160 [Candidatus Sulfopaludibacter sp.]|nr:hypothetical protein [Candidatus Sulfopaludibacter sp.]
MPPRLTCPVTLLISSSIWMDTSPPSCTRGVISTFTPTSIYVNCVLTKAFAAVALAPAE